MAMTADATTQQLEDKLGPYPQIKQVVDATLAVWPQHLRYLEKRFADDRPESMERCNEFASLGLKVIGDALGEYVADYRWMCEEFLAEEFFFQRNGHQLRREVRDSSENGRRNRRGHQPCTGSQRSHGRHCRSARQR